MHRKELSCLDVSGFSLPLLPAYYPSRIKLVRLTCWLPGLVLPIQQTAQDLPYSLKVFGAFQVASSWFPFRIQGTCSYPWCLQCRLLVAHYPQLYFFDFLPSLCYHLTTFLSSLMLFFFFNHDRHTWSSKIFCKNNCKSFDGDNLANAKLINWLKWMIVNIRTWRLSNFRLFWYTIVYMNPSHRGGPLRRWSGYFCDASAMCAQSTGCIANCVWKTKQCHLAQNLTAITLFYIICYLSIIR